ncbi:sce7726 family protein [Citrobacter sp. Cb028]|uniref:sce7726 family protein n=1 Tax=Citrobacter sp. Cb028 TaxID=2985024 RepID=UPI002577334E|nr:sce7726 family protein [Citrobacter sp. Cb028]MDM3453203.1 sce7726 family protein [Citrobacter sp. Cb028]
MNYQAISKIFSRNVVLEIAKKNRSELFRSIVMDNCPAYSSTDKSIAKIYDELYLLLKKKYRNEYIYKNEIAKKIVKGFHRFNKVSYVNEFKINGCIADVAIFNDTSTAYEIKTELDSFERLDDQLSVYKDVFEFVYMVVPAEKLNQAMKVAHETTGIITLNGKNALNYERLATSNLEYFSKDKMFNCFKPSEYMFFYESVTGIKTFGRAADVKEQCRNLFLELDTKKAHKEMLKVLTARELEGFEKDYFLSLPQSLLATLLNLRLNQKNLMTLRENMTETLC